MEGPGRGKRRAFPPGGKLSAFPYRGYPYCVQIFFGACLPAQEIEVSPVRDEGGSRSVEAGFVIFPRISKQGTGIEEKKHAHQGENEFYQAGEAGPHLLDAGIQVPIVAAREKLGSIG